MKTANSKEAHRGHAGIPGPVLVTGGAGFIGSHTVDALLEQGTQVRVLDDLSTGQLENLPLRHPRLEVVIGDIVNEDIVGQAMAGTRSCVHLAAQVSAARSLEDPYTSALNNVLGFINVLKSAQELNLDRLVYASSAAVYGNCEQLPLREDVALKPVNPYGLEKLIDEQYADLYARLYGMSCLGLRYFNVYGPRQRPDSPYSGVISKFFDQLDKHQPPTIFGDGRQTRDFVAVADVARANITALASDCAGACNVATGSRVDLLQLLSTLNHLLDSHQEPVMAPARTGDIRHSCGNASRLEKELGVTADTPLEQGLARLVAASTPRKTLRPRRAGRTANSDSKRALRRTAAAHAL